METIFSTGAVSNSQPIQIQLGSLRKVDVRDAWQNEATDFTPWLALAPNLRLLGETIGLQLELEAVERNVGPFARQAQRYAENLTFKPALAL